MASCSGKIHDFGSTPESGVILGKYAANAADLYPNFVFQPGVGIVKRFSSGNPSSVTIYATQSITDEGNPYDIYTRDFGPAVGVAEDPVTGAANGALAGYLVLEEILNSSAPHSLRITQGDAIGRPGIVYVDTRSGDQIETLVGGTAVVTVSGRVYLD